MNPFVKNGAIIQALENVPSNRKLWKYYGVARYKTWPLEDETDSLSQKLSSLTFDYWITSPVGCLYTITTQDLLIEYYHHCLNLNKSVRCLMVESLRDNPVCRFINSNSIKSRFLGYDVVDTDLQSSCLADALSFGNNNPFMDILTLNENGLFSSYSKANLFLLKWERYAQLGTVEQYFQPLIIRLFDITDYLRYLQ